jgi:hypothetical protein
MLQSRFRRISMQHVVEQLVKQQSNATGGAPAAPNHAPDLILLARYRRCYSYIVWNEYEHGIGGRKAAHLIAREERAKVKHNYTRRKLV